jgi:phosphopantetheine adenylyltransferase
MNIESVKNTTGGYVVNNQFFIPIDEGNFDYQDVKTWINAGNIVEPELIPVEDAKEKELEAEKLKKEKEISDFIENHKIAIAHDDGSCSILDISFEMLNDDSSLKQNLFKEEYRLVSNSDLPTELPEAWTDDFNTETVDIHNEKARQILLERMRKERDSRFPPLDIASLRALEDGDKIKLEEIKNKKQILRNATEPLKNLIIKKFNSLEVLEQIKKLAKI